MNRREAVDVIKMAIAQVEWDYPMDYAAAFDKAIEALEQPELVRCQDCKYGEECIPPCEDRYCVFYDERHDGNWFCADGERR